MGVSCAAEDCTNRWKKDGGVSFFSTYMSDLWTGHASYKMITKHCGLVDLLSEGDVMADRGFDVQDILSAARVTLNIPPTLPTSRSQFTLADVDKTRHCQRPDFCRMCHWAHQRISHPGWHYADISRTFG